MALSARWKNMHWGNTERHRFARQTIHEAKEMSSSVSDEQSRLAEVYEHSALCSSKMAAEERS